MYSRANASYRVYSCVLSLCNCSLWDIFSQRENYLKQREEVKMESICEVCSWGLEKVAGCLCICRRGVFGNGARARGRVGCRGKKLQGGSVGVGVSTTTGAWGLFGGRIQHFTWMRRQSICMLIP